nr:hypothetical protein [Lactobacillus helveticus]
MKFKITKNYAKEVRGRKLIGYTFSFKPESKTQKDVGYNKRLEETTHLYSIMTNTYLNTEQKFRAVDRYRGLKLGTTKKYYESAHPQTVFLDPESVHRAKRGYPPIDQICMAYQAIKLQTWKQLFLHTKIC